MLDETFGVVSGGVDLVIELVVAVAEGDKKACGVVDKVDGCACGGFAG